MKGRRAVRTRSAFWRIGRSSGPFEGFERPKGKDAAKQRGPGRAQRRIARERKQTTGRGPVASFFDVYVKSEYGRITKMRLVRRSREE